MSDGAESGIDWKQYATKAKDAAVQVGTKGVELAKQHPKLAMAAGAGVGFVGLHAAAERYNARKAEKSGQTQLEYYADRWAANKLKAAQRSEQRWHVIKKTITYGTLLNPMLWPLAPVAFGANRYAAHKEHQAQRKQNRIINSARKR